MSYMRLIPSDPDIETLLRRIQRGSLDLQPDFQRGEVWSVSKRQLLIDSILRDWHVPPIHVVETDKGEEVLDGQQRLVAIRDFHLGDLKVNGNAEPKNIEIASLHGLNFCELPVFYQERFLRFVVRFFKAVDYSSEEPAELFYRLNQPVTLTTPEQRNAFFGPVREQIRRVVQEYTGRALSKEFLGFSNSRMAWDDVVARVCFVLEAGTLRSKITASRLASRYRMDQPFPEEVIASLDGALEVLSNAQPFIKPTVRFNKATAFSWLYFLSRAQGCNEEEPAKIGAFIAAVEMARQRAGEDVSFIEGQRLSTELTTRLLVLLHDRARSRVGDVFSVLLRDFVLWALLYSLGKKIGLTTLQEQSFDQLFIVSEICEKLEAWAPPSSQAADGEGDEEGWTQTFEAFLENVLAEAQWESVS